MDVLYDEIESLEAILMDDVKIIRNEKTNFPELIETTVQPMTGDVEHQYVCITLQVMANDGYPDISPKFKLRNPRGLDDKSINAIEQAVKDKLYESIGLPVVFDLIDVIREHLTESNLPTGQCVICLYGFQDGDQFTKTNCYHYLHSYCLARHLVASKKNYQEEQDKLPAWQRKLSKLYQPVCPVCREIINDDDVEQLLNAVPPTELENAPKFQLTIELKNLQTKMCDLFLHQKKRGGIIDLDADDNNVILLENESNNGDNDSTKNQQDGQHQQQQQPPTFETPIPTSQQSPISRSSNRAHSHSSHHHRGGAGSSVVGGSTSNRGGYIRSNHGYSNRNYNRNRRGVHNHHNQQQGNTQQPCSSNPR